MTANKTKTIYPPTVTIVAAFAIGISGMFMAAMYLDPNSNVVDDPNIPSTGISESTLQVVQQPCVTSSGSQTFDICYSVFTDPVHGCEYIVASRARGNTPVSITPRTNGKCDTTAQTAAANHAIYTKLDTIASQLEAQAAATAGEKQAADALYKLNLEKQLHTNEMEAAILRSELGLPPPIVEDSHKSHTQIIQEVDHSTMDHSMMDHSMMDHTTPSESLLETLTEDQDMDAVDIIEAVDEIMIVIEELESTIKELQE